MFFTQFGLLFTNMEWYVVVPFVLGLVFLFIEFLQPGFGIFGIGGSVFLVAAIVLRAVFHTPEDNVVMQIFQFLLIDVLLLGTCFLFFFIAQKRGWLKKGIFAIGSAVDPDHSCGTEDFSYLVGKEGTTVTTLHPAGKAEIEGRTYDVLGDFLIEPGKIIIVTATEGGKISVTEKKLSE